MLDKRLEFTDSQKDARSSLAKALCECEAAGLGIAFDHRSTLYAWNGKDVNFTSFREDSAADSVDVSLSDLPSMDFDPL